MAMPEKYQTIDCRKKPTYEYNSGGKLTRRWERDEFAAKIVKNIGKVKGVGVKDLITEIKVL